MNKINVEFSETNEQQKFKINSMNDGKLAEIEKSFKLWSNIIF